jgi:hypothetical protein
MVPSIHHVRRKAQQTCQRKHNANPPRHIILIEPGNQLRYVRPEFPAHDECDGEVKQGGSGGVLGGVVARDGDDADVEEVDEKLVAGNFLRGAGAPEEATVEVLAHQRALVDADGFTEFAVGAPLVFVKGGLVDGGVRGSGGSVFYGACYALVGK